MQNKQVYPFEGFVISGGIESWPVTWKICFESRDQTIKVF